MLLIRFLAVGTIAALLPFVAQIAGERLAGKVVLIPVVAVLSLFFLGREQGTPAMGQTAAGGLVGLGPLFVFLALVAGLTVVAPAMPQIGILAISFAAWTATVALSEFAPNWLPWIGTLAITPAIVVAAKLHVKDLSVIGLGLITLDLPVLIISDTVKNFYILYPAIVPAVVGILLFGAGPFIELKPAHQPA